MSTAIFLKTFFPHQTLIPLYCLTSSLTLSLPPTHFRFAVSPLFATPPTLLRIGMQACHTPPLCLPACKPTFICSPRPAPPRKRRAVLETGGALFEIAAVLRCTTAPLASSLAKVFLFHFLEALLWLNGLRQCFCSRFRPGSKQFSRP